MTDENLKYESEIEKLKAALTREREAYRAAAANRDALSEEVTRLRGILDRPYPIQRGPSVPWWVMAPHEAQSQRNHGQSIKRIAERGGFSGAEAWCIVTGQHWHAIEKNIEEGERLWRTFAAQVNDPRDKRDPETISRALLRSNEEGT
jgi:hypothetical protein